MVSRKQLEANKTNALRSTGPKTASGKAKSRGNAWKHGLTAKSFMIGEERPSQFTRFAADLEAHYRPANSMEHVVVDQVATLMWRLRRIPVFEAAVINRGQDSSLLSSALIYSGVLSKLSRYETGLMSSLLRTLQLLHSLQDERQRGSVVDIAAALPPPANAA
jgi:hypothetical protein